MVHAGIFQHIPGQAMIEILITIKMTQHANIFGEHLPMYNMEGKKIVSDRPNLAKVHPLPFNAIAMAYEAHIGHAPLFYKVDGNPDTSPMNHNPSDKPREEVDELAAERGMVRMSMGRALGQSYHLSDGIWSDGTDCTTPGARPLRGRGLPRCEKRLSYGRICCSFLCSEWCQSRSKRSKVFC